MKFYAEILMSRGVKLAVEGLNPSLDLHKLAPD